MHYNKVLWVALIALTFLGTTAEARTRRNKLKKQRPQADTPEGGIQNQQPEGDDYPTDYEYNEYAEYDDNRRRKCNPLNLC